MLQDLKPGESDTFVGESKEERKVEEKKQPTEIKPPDEFIYDPVSQEESH